MEEEHELLSRSFQKADGDFEKYSMSTTLADNSDTGSFANLKGQDDGILAPQRRIVPAVPFYQRVLQSPLIRYCVYVIPIAALLVLPIVIFAEKPPNKRTVHGVNGLGLSIYAEILWLSLWLAKLIAAGIPVLFSGIGSIFSPGAKKYAVILTAIEIPVSIFLWTIMVLSWFPIVCVFDTEVCVAQFDKDTPLKTFFNFIRASAGCAALLLIEKSVMQIISFAYHGKQYRQKIEKVKATTKALEFLYDASLRKYPDRSVGIVLEEDLIIHDTCGVQQTLKDASAGYSVRRVLGEIHYLGEQTVSIFGKMIRAISGSQKALDLTGSHAIVRGALGRRTGAEALANRIFKALVPNGMSVLTYKDITDALPSGFTDEEKNDADWIFTSLDYDGNGNISRGEMILLAIDLHQTRLDMLENAVNIKDAINVLDRVITFFLILIVTFIYAAVFSTWVAQNAGTFGMALSAPAFALSITVGEFIGACLFVFVKHPYDVGDRVMISKVEYQVVRISLLYTVFKTIDGDTISQITNTALSPMWIDNMTRSGPMKERYQFSVFSLTTFQDIEKLRIELENFVRAPENQRDYQHDIDIQLLSIGDLKQLDLRVDIKFKVSHSNRLFRCKLTPFQSNWANESLRAYRRSKFMCGLLSAMRKVNIDPPGGIWPVTGSKEAPSYYVTVDQDTAKANTEAFFAKKEKQQTTEVVVAGEGTTVSSGLEVLPNLFAGLNRQGSQRTVFRYGEQP